MSESDPSQTQPQPSPDAEAKQRRSRRRRRISGVTLVVLIVPLAMLAGLFWAMTERTVALPRSIVDRLELRLSEGLEGRSMGLGAVGLGYDLDRAALRLVVQNTTVNDTNTQRTVLRLPRVTAFLDGQRLLRGEVALRAIGLEGATLQVTRDQDGQLDLRLGEGGGQLPRTVAQALGALDAVLDLDALADLAVVRAEGLQIYYADLGSGHRRTIRDGTLSLTQTTDEARATLSFSLPGSVPGAGPATVALSLTRDRRGGGAAADVLLTDVALVDAAQLSGLDAAGASYLSARVSGAARAVVSETDGIGVINGRVELADGQWTSLPDLQFDRATLTFDYNPANKRITLDQIGLTAPQAIVAATGQVLLDPEAPLSGPVQVQLALSRLELDPTGLFDAPVVFDSGVIEGRFNLQTGRADLGQAMLDSAGGRVLLSGWGDVQIGTGLRGALDVRIPFMQVARLKALWPGIVVPKTRKWAMENLFDGTIHDLTLALRPPRPGQALPQATGSFSYRDATVRFMRFMPAGRDAVGVAMLDGQRFALRVDQGWVPALRLEDEASLDTAASPRVQIGGTSLTIPDLTQRPATGEVDLRVAGPIPAILQLMDNRPFRLLERSGRSSDLAQGQASVRAHIRLPLVKGVKITAVEYEATGELRAVRSDTLVPGRALSADLLRLTARKDAVEISGAVQLAGVPAEATWTQPLRPDPQPGQAGLPSKVTGSAPLSRDTLTAFGINLGDVALSGSSRVGFTVDLPGQGAAPTLAVTSNLTGLAMGLPALGWSKSAGSSGTLELNATLGNPAQVTALSFDAAGLSTTGQITLRADGGGLERASFDRVRLGGWLDAGVTLIGQGAGRPAQIVVSGGSADLRRATFGTQSGGRAASNAPLIEIALDSLTLSAGITLNRLRATLTRAGGLSGQFTAEINDAVPINGTLVPSAQGPAIRVRADNAGAVMRAAGVFKTGYGGAFDLTLVPGQGSGRYRGQLQINDLRVRDAPSLVALLQAVSVVGIVEQLTGEGLFFSSVESAFELAPQSIRILNASAVGPSMSVTADGFYDPTARSLDLQGVVSPLYVVNGLFGGLFGRRNEGLFGFNYTLTGSADAPRVQVNPLSILTPGLFREIFRRPPPVATQ